MSIAITGAAGHLGRHVITTLLDAGTKPGDVVAVVRDPAKITDLAESGVDVRPGDYDDPPSLLTALDGVETLLLVSSPQVGSRVPQHYNVVAAATSAGVRRLAYTSVLHADTSRIGLAAEHRDTERAIAESGIAFTFLRNGWYWENFTNNVRGTGLLPTLDSGVLIGSGGDGILAGAARADYAEAAANVLITTGHEARTYELGGDRVTCTEFAAAIAEATGKPVVYKNLSEDDYRRALISAGLTDNEARTLASYDAGIARGELDTDTGDLQRLLGRLPTPVADVIGNAYLSTTRKAS